MESRTNDAETTPARKRKADEDPKKPDSTKKIRPTFTPRSQGNKPKRYTPARREKMATEKTTEQAPTRQDRPVMMNELKDYMGDWTTKLSDKLTKTLTAGLTRDFSEAVSVVAGSVAVNTKNIEAINNTIKKIQKESNDSAEKLEKKVERLESVILASKSSRPSLSEQREDEHPPIVDIMQVDMRVREENMARSDSYAIARRSLRIWPIKGTDDAEIRRAAIDFIRNKLQVDESELLDEQICRVRRSKPPRKSRVRFEALVTFQDKFARDAVAAHGKNLSDFIDSTGLPTAGTRLDYPAFLGTAFRLLDWYGKQMRDRHGKGTRRNIKYDDDEENLYLDVCLPSQDYWHRVSPDEAKRYKTQVETERTHQTRRSLEGPLSNPQRGQSNRKDPPPAGGGGAGGYVSPIKRR